MNKPIQPSMIVHKLSKSYEATAGELYETIAKTMPATAEGYSAEDLKQVLDIVTGGLEAVRKLLLAISAPTVEVGKIGEANSDASAQEVGANKVEVLKSHNPKSLLRRQWLIETFRNRCDEWLSVSEILSFDSNGEIFGNGESRYTLLSDALKFTGFKHNSLRSKSSRYMLTAETLSLYYETISGVAADIHDESTSTEEEAADFLDLAATLN